MRYGAPSALTPAWTARDSMKHAGSHLDDSWIGARERMQWCGGTGAGMGRVPGTYQVQAVLAVDSTAVIIAHTQLA